MTKSVIVIGGGPGGGYAAAALDKDKRFSVTLVDTKAVSEFVPGTPSMVAGLRDDKALDKYVRSAVVPHTQYVKNGRVVIGTVSAVSDDLREVTLADGTVLRADYLVVATGSSYAGPWKLPPDAPVADAAAYKLRLTDERARLEAAKHVLVIGGGAVGVEVAAEVASSFADKRVTLVSSGARLLPEAAPGLGARAADWFSLRENCTVVLGERAVEQADGSYTTTVSNQRFEPDLVYVCYGLRPNSGFMPAAALAGSGFVAVEPTMQVRGFTHAFAVGDVADHGQSYMTKTAMEHGMHAARAIKALESGKAPSQMPKEPPGYICSLGPSSGVADMGCVKLVGWSKSGSSVAGKIKGVVVGKVMGGLK